MVILLNKIHIIISKIHAQKYLIRCKKECLRKALKKLLEDNNYNNTDWLVFNMLHHKAT